MNRVSMRQRMDSSYNTSHCMERKEQDLLRGLISCALVYQWTPCIALESNLDRRWMASYILHEAHET